MPACLQGRLLGRVAHQVEEPAGLHLGNPLWILLDDHERDLRCRPALRRRGPRPGRSRRRSCALKRLDLPHHALMTQVLLELALGEQREEPAQRERHREEPQAR